jgi:transcriptional regulator with XRE-family HTH domain
MLARAAGETQADVARAAGLSTTRVAQIEREER